MEKKVNEVRIKLINTRPLDETPVLGPEECNDVMRNLIGDLNSERCVVAYLNSSNRVMNYMVVGIGNTGTALIDIKSIIQGALLQNTPKMIIYHNHPSQNLEPSQEDIQFTGKLYAVCKLHDLELLDHVIVGINDTYSMMQNGQMNLYQMSNLINFKEMREHDIKYKRFPDEKVKLLKEVTEARGRCISFGDGKIYTFWPHDETDHYCFSNIDAAIRYEKGYRIKKRTIRSK